MSELKEKHTSFPKVLWHSGVTMLCLKNKMVGLISNEFFGGRSFTGSLTIDCINDLAWLVI